MNTTTTPAATTKLNPKSAAAISAIIRGAIEIWATHANKPEGWKPSQQEWDDMIALNEKSPDDFYREAAARLGVDWTDRVALADQ